MIKEESIIKRKYTFILIIITSVICSVMVYFYLFSINEISDIYIGKTQETILRTKKDFLKDTVSNIISEIDIERKSKIKYMEKLITDAESIINLKRTLVDKEFNDFFVEFFKDNSNYDFWTVILWNNKENRAIYDSQKLAGESWEDTLNIIKFNLVSYRIVIHGDETAVFGIKKSYIDEFVKSTISDKVRNLKFNDDSYIWINEIINYQGGKNYAVRRVHPNLPNTEGIYLSTDMTDVKGNFPYLTELQGINKDGELFFTYYFKELYNDTVSEKLTYAKLYKDFNWVIAMGIYINDLQSYIDQTNKESKALASKLTLILVFLFIIILILSYSLIMLIEKLYYRHSKKLLESEINQDLLTKAGSRRSGTNDLISAFKEYKRDGSNHGIIMFDIDYFKNINDTYGHAAGDLVLIEIVEAINCFIRSSDKLIRWGGDEFIIIFYGLQKKNALSFAEKILSVASSLKISVENKEITPTLSIGVSYFKATDSDFADVLKRADQALYKSKTNGRNQVNLML